MATELRTWQIIDGKLTAIDSALKNEGRTESYDLEPWLESNPEIISSDMIIIGRQVRTKSGPIDLLGIDKSGNTVIVEMKRDQLPRECLAQAIDYASAIAGWTVERLTQVCSEYTNKTLEDAFNEAFPDVDLETVNLNSTQRIALVGFSIETSLERMIEWLSDSYGVNVNATILSYVKTKSGDELLTKASIISDERQQGGTGKKKFEIEMSDEPGTHNVQELKQLLLAYLARDRVTNGRIRDILLPALLETTILTRNELKKAFVNFDPSYDESKVGLSLTGLSSQLGMKKNDFLRQVIAYKYPRYDWEKDTFSIIEEHRDLVQEVLRMLKH